MTNLRLSLHGRTAWMISDGKAGNNVQMRGVLEALGVEIILKSVSPRGLQRILSPWIGVSQSERFGKPGSRFSSPWPDVAIAIGRLTTPYIRELKRRAGNETFIIILQDPKVHASSADLFWVPEHDKLRGANIITTLTAPHGFSEQRLRKMKDVLPPDIARLNRPRVAVMLGGSNGDYRYNSASLARLAAVLRRMIALGYGLMITPSRRTESDIISCVRKATEGASCIFWDMSGDNPYPSFLAHADAFLAPADSVNMTGEPCATGKPVYVFHPDGGSAKFSKFHAALEAYGATRRLHDEFDRLENWTYAPLNSAQEIADAIAQRWMARHANVVGNT